MRKSILTLMTILGLGLGSYAQTQPRAAEPKESIKTFKAPKRSSKIHIDLPKAEIEGYSGNEIVFTLKSAEKPEDERAKGLTAINGMGLQDNTGLGINVTETGGVMQVSQLNRTSAADIKILVPNGMILAFDHQSQFGRPVSIKNFQGEIEVSTNHGGVELENVSGPLSVQSIHGAVNARFSQNVAGPISIVSIHGLIDLSVAPTLQADLKMSTKFGEFFISPEFKLELQKDERSTEFNNQVTGKINGGGLNINLSSDHGKIYLRTK